jgi:Flp pilus assembly protein TadD
VQALAANPQSARVLVALGDVKRAQSQCMEVIRFYRRAVEIEPHDYDGNYGLGEVCRAASHDGKQSAGAGRTKEAVVELEAAVKIDPREPEARLALARAYARAGKFAGAVEQFRQLRELAPRDPEYAYYNPPGSRSHAAIRSW